MSDGLVDQLFDQLFVYGTLRAGSGHPMHEVLAKAADRVCAATVTGRLVRVDWYPGLVLDSSAGRVHGDLWRLRDFAVLRALDEYEGDEYERRVVEVRRADGSTSAAFAYVFTAPADDLEVVASGDWLRQS